MIKVSETAKKKVVELMTDDGYDAVTDYVRVGVKSGGCSGLSYDLKFDKEQQEGDKVFEDNGIKFFNANGDKLSVEAEQEIENIFFNDELIRENQCTHNEIGKAKR